MKTENRPQVSFIPIVRASEKRFQVQAGDPMARIGDHPSSVFMFTGYGDFRLEYKLFMEVGQVAFNREMARVLDMARAKTQTNPKV